MLNLPIEKNTEGIVRSGVVIEHDSDHRFFVRWDDDPGRREVKTDLYPEHRVAVAGPLLLGRWRLRGNFQAEPLRSEWSADASSGGGGTVCVNCLFTFHGTQCPICAVDVGELGGVQNHMPTTRLDRVPFEGPNLAWRQTHPESVAAGLWPTSKFFDVPRESVVEMTSDGDDCAFEAMRRSLQLIWRGQPKQTGGADLLHSARDLRVVVAAALHHHHSSRSVLYGALVSSWCSYLHPDSTPEVRVRTICEGTQWGGVLELMLVARVYDVNVLVLVGATTGYRPIAWRPSRKVDAQHLVRRTIILLASPCHYDMVEALPLSAWHSLFPDADWESVAQHDINRWESRRIQHDYLHSLGLLRQASASRTDPTQCLLQVAQLPPERSWALSVSEALRRLQDQQPRQPVANFTPYALRQREPGTNRVYGALDAVFNAARAKRDALLQVGLSPLLEVRKSGSRRGFGVFAKATLQPGQCLSALPCYLSEAQDYDTFATAVEQSRGRVLSSFEDYMFWIDDDVFAVGAREGRGVQLVNSPDLALG